MTSVGMFVRFSDFKKSDKLAIRNAERRDPVEFRSQVVKYVLSSSAQTETESYRLQMLGEFVGEMMPDVRLDELRNLLTTTDTDMMTSLAVDQFRRGLEIGAIIESPTENVAGGYRQIVVHPD